MSKADIDRLVTYQYATGDSEAKRPSGDSAETQTSCVVCMCDFAHRQRVRELPCQHIFHAKCIDKWLKVDTFNALITVTFSKVCEMRGNSLDQNYCADVSL
jgi:Ring finger domain